MRYYPAWKRQPGRSRAKSPARIKCTICPLSSALFFAFQFPGLCLDNAIRSLCLFTLVSVLINNYIHVTDNWIMRLIKFQIVKFTYFYVQPKPYCVILQVLKRNWKPQKCLTKTPWNLTVLDMLFVYNCHVTICQL